MEIFTNKLPASLWFAFALIVLMLLPCFSYADDSVIGKVVSSDGNNTVKQEGQSSRTLNANDEIKLTDLIQTGNDSVVIISFIDGAKATLRPNSTLYIKQYGEIEAKLSLVKGGARIIAGEIARRVPALFKVITPDGEITAQNQNAEFSVRICEQEDCHEENLLTTIAETIDPGTHVSVESGVISIVGPSDAPPIFVSENLSVSIELTGSVSSLSSPSSFQTNDPFYAPFFSAGISATNINTIVIGVNPYGSTTDSVSGAASVATAVIQEQTIGSPY